MSFADATVVLTVAAELVSVALLAAEANGEIELLARVAKLLGAVVRTRILPSKKPYYSVSLAGYRCRVWMLRLLPLMGARRQAKIADVLSGCDPQLIIEAARAVAS